MLTEQQIRLYARQVILRELGQAGQAQLCASRVAIEDRGSAQAAQVASDYLRRAGLHLQDDAQALSVAAPSAADVEATAGEPALQACAEWLLGAWTAVETIKRVVGVGSAAASDPSPWITDTEVD